MHIHFYKPKTQTIHSLSPLSNNDYQQNDNISHTVLWSLFLKKWLLKKKKNSHTKSIEFTSQCFH